MELVQILNEEGFEWLGGRLLSAISLGRPPIKFYDHRQETSGTLPHETIVEDYDREPIPLAEQLSEAVEFLRLTLIEPARRLAEAEVIGGRITDGKPIRIEFIDSEGSVNRTLKNGAEPGDAKTAVKLHELLLKLLEVQP